MAPIDWQVNGHAQAAMMGTEVVDRANQIHGLVQGRRLTSQCTAATHQGCHARAKGGIQPLDIGCIDSAPALGLSHQGPDLSHRSLHQPSLDPDHSFSHVALDHLSNAEIVPRSQTRRPRLSQADRFAKDGPDGMYVGLTAISAEQQGPTQSTGADLLHQDRDQLRVAARAEHTAQPKTRTHLQSHRHPDHTALDLHPNLIPLHLAQFPRPFDQVLMYLSTMLPGSFLPTDHRPFIQTEGRHDSLNWAAMSQQGDHDDDQFLALPQAIEDRAFGCGERRVADMADVTAILLAEHPNVAFTYLPSCRTVRVVAKYCLRVHWLASLSDWSQTELANGLVFCQSAPRPRFNGVLPDFATFVRNSVIVVSAGTALAVVVGALAGYSLARLPMSRRFRNNAAFFILSTRMTPAMVAIVPFFTLYKNLGWLNTLHGLIVAYTCAALPFAVWMMQSFIQEIPPDLEEAAMVDGDSRIGALFRIVLPLARPGLAATAIFSAIVLWNEFLFAFILTTTDSARTLPVGIASLNAAFEFMYSSMASVATLAIIPIWICALIVQRYLVRGLTMGAVK
jgi:multiple sugar transport system permease protein